MGVTKGTLIRWVESHKSYEANGDVLVGLEPIYNYGIIMEVSQKNPNYIAVASFGDGRWRVVDVHNDDIKIVSEPRNG